MGNQIHVNSRAVRRVISRVEHDRAAWARRVAFHAEAVPGAIPE